MSVATAAELIGTLRQLSFLDPSQLDALTRAVAGSGGQSRALAQKLIERGWLTPFQANQLLQGRGADLVLGSYILLERLGEGGMGTVFKARHRNLDRVVALKLIRKDLLDRPQAVKRFHREIKAAAALNHPNIVLAYDADQHGSAHFLTMEYVEGTDLARVVKERGPLPVATARDYIRQAALGLQHAGERGLVHRDIKPHNLLLTTKGVVKILDMGLARIARPEGDEESGSSLTRQGTVMGTYDYIAPEQAMDSHSVDIRADLYSLGCTFYFLLTGRVPFPGGDGLSKLMKHKLDEPEPIARFRSDVSPGIVAVIRKLMAKDPQHRFPSGNALAAALAGDAPLATAVLAGPPVAIAPVAIRDPLPAESVTVAMTYAPAAISSHYPSGASASRAEPVPSVDRRRKTPVFLVLIGSVFLLGLVAGTICVTAYSGSRYAEQLRKGGSEAPRPPASEPSGEPKTNISNSIGMKLRYIKSGSFKMGTSDEDVERIRKEANQGYQFPDWDKVETPQHEVRITHGFYLGVFEVTQGQYSRVTGKNPSQNKESPQHPVENVNWLEAMEFCTKLSELPEEQREGRKYRLPTEAEWEYACRAGSTTLFFQVDALSSFKANIDPDHPFGNPEKGPKVGKSLPVGSFAPNAWGLYDMHGNVWEWCLDGPRKYGKRAEEDPIGPHDQGGTRILRGGGFLRGATRAAFRKERDAAAYRIPDGGFRVVCEIKPAG